MNLRHCPLDISFSDEYAYKEGPARCKEQEIYTDNDIVWSEIGKHVVPTENGTSRVNFAEGFNKLLPEKAEELGFKQAYLEAFLGMLKCGASHSEIEQNLSLSEEQIHELLSVKTVKYRIFPASTIEAVRHTAADHFKAGYNLAYETIERSLEVKGTYEAAIVRKFGIACARKEICKFLKGGIV